MPFADLLQWLSQSRKTGTLVFEGSKYSKKVYFRDGLIIAAASENPKEFLSYYLVGWDYLTEDELQAMLQMQDRHKTMLGELLVIVGHLTREQLIHILRVKTEEAIYEVFHWPTGEFKFLESMLPSAKMHPCNLPVDGLILEGVRRHEEFANLRELIPSDRHRPKLIRAVDVDSMGELELAIIREINGRQSIEKIALQVHLAVFHVANFVYHGLTQDLMELLDPGGGRAHDVPSVAGAWEGEIKKLEAMIDSDAELGVILDLARELREEHRDRPEALEKLRELSTRLDSRLSAAGVDQSAVPVLAVSFKELTSLSCSPEEGFLISRINGTYTLGEIFRLVPGELRAKRLSIARLKEQGVIDFVNKSAAAG